MFAALSKRSPVGRSVNLKRGFSSAPTGDLKKTSLHDFHIEHGAKMAEFAGYNMPIQYPDGIVNSHLHCRTSAGLFDVSHMRQLRLTGKDRVRFLETICVSDVESIPANTAQLSSYTNEKGGIIDDTIITNRGDHFFVVVNAGCADKDVAHYREQMSKFNGDVKLEIIDRSLLALQGPKAAAALQKLVKVDLSKQQFMTCQEIEVQGAGKCLVSRCGYTGEDGFEISVAHSDAVGLAKTLLSNTDVKLAGLGPRDSLRLEAGLCLYGHDIDDTTTPVEANLTWTIGKKRREKGGFLGADTILAQLKNPALVTKKRVGFIVSGPPARDGATILSSDNAVIGKITSGTFSPIMKQAIGMGYVQTPFSKLDTKVQVQVRGKNYPAVVAKMPFVPTNYFKTK